ncbi:hypothetical protein [Candidatus Nitrosotenuis cloacae]|uniref:hypothetical protein n=1 Tax=Candidatus Nitrosotenuis cloacae TaxID=1603555 RepID=UPI00227FDE3E|nr:hypothetical protein [Candidatus Nitrosotenuis cloacae]
MQFSEDQVRDALETRDYIEAEIQRRRQEIETLEKNLALINSILKQQSFTKASALKDSKFEVKKEQAPQNKESADYSVPLRKSNGGSLIANAHITPDKVSIILDESVSLREDMHPFKSFFIERVIGEMRKKDMADLEKGAINENSMIDCMVNKDGTLLREIIIKNYRQKERVNEIISTATWSFSKMIDNSK